MPCRDLFWIAILAESLNAIVQNSAAQRCSQQNSPPPQSNFGLISEFLTEQFRVNSVFGRLFYVEFSANIKWFNHTPHCAILSDIFAETYFYYETINSKQSTTFVHSVDNECLAVSEWLP